MSRHESTEYLLVSAQVDPDAPGGVRVELRHRRTLQGARGTARSLYGGIPGRSLVLRLRLDTYAGYPAIASEEVVLRVPHGAPATRPHNPLSSQRRHRRRLLARLRALAEKVNP